MNNYKADIDWHAGPAKTLRGDNAIAITATSLVNGNTTHYSITYRQFTARVRHLAGCLASAGINKNHRVLIVGDNLNIIDPICWTWAAIYLNASPGNASAVESADDVQLKAGAGNCDAIVQLDGTIELKIGFDSNSGGKVHFQEAYILYSSGTTKKPSSRYGVEPQFFQYPKCWKGGLAHSDQLGLATRFLGDVPINQIACHGWEVAYAPHNVVQCIMTGGTYHWVSSPELIPEAQKEYKTNLMSNYPLSYDPICEAFGDMIDYGAIEFVEVAGGICTPQLIRKIRKTIKPRIISNSYISSKSGTILTRTIGRDDPADQCEWMENPHLDHTLRLRLDTDNVLWYKRNDSEWLTDNDVFEQKGKQYRVVGKAKEQFLRTAFAKISVWEIENFANQLTRTVWGCGEHTYCFSMNAAAELMHGLVYSGPLDINLMKERMDKLEWYKRPAAIYQVKPEFWSLNIKISRDHMAERLYENPEYILNQL